MRRELFRVYLPLVLAVFIVVAVLSGCGGKGGLLNGTHQQPLLMEG